MDLADGRIAVYLHDPFGRRYLKDVDGQVTYFVYSDEGLIGEYAAGGSQIRGYGWKPDNTWGTDPVFMIESGQYYYYHNDHLGTPQQMTDSTGTVVWSADYAAFGSATVAAASTITNNLRFPGQYYDAETGLHYNWNRYYDPVTGRYTQVDPIGFDAGDENLYRYVGNNPVNLIDPYGLLVSAYYDSSHGILTVVDTDTGQLAVMQAESGGKPWGDSISPGTYEILGHRDPNFFRLDAVDNTPRNDIYDAYGRNHLRLHKPGRTTGCIAAKDEDEWSSVRDLIHNTRTTTVPDNAKPWWKFWGGSENITNYGTLVVQ